MGKPLGYDFDKVLIKRNVYSPVGHGKIERENEQIRKSVLNILGGEAALAVSINHVEVNEDIITRQNELQALMIDYYKKENNK